jgi:phosphatidate cytidylyltransferase
VGSRLLIAIPGITLGILLVYAGPIPLAAGLVIIALLGLLELNSLIAATRPLRWATDLGAALCILLPLVGSSPEHQVLIGVVAVLVLAMIGGLIAVRRHEVTLQLSVTVFGALYLGVPFGLLVAMRQLPHGAGAVANVLVGTWAFDTFSYLGGRAWGRRPIAPRTSPHKTVEGFIIGILGGTGCVVIAGLYMPYFTFLQSLLIGVSVCVGAFVGDLVESMIKRDADVKDSGHLLLGHGGILDRFDAVLVSIPVAYFVTTWLVG